MIVIGIGDPYRRDRGVGPAVVSRLRWRGLPGVVLAKSGGEPTELIELWDGQDLAVVVDGIITERVAPGHVHRLSLHHPALAEATAVAHRPSLRAAVELARALDRTPRQLLLLAVEIVDVAPGQGLSPVVAAACRRVADEVTELLAAAPQARAR